VSVVSTFVRYDEQRYDEQRWAKKMKKMNILLLDV